MKRALTIFLFSFPLFSQQISVASATSTKVKLAWNGTAPAWVIERKGDTGVFQKLGTSGAAEFEDEKIDPFGTYQYRVKAGDAGKPSNVVIVGPPLGHKLAVPLPAGIEPADFAQHPSIALDSNGDPAIAYCQGKTNASVLLFVSWDRAHYKWNPPVSVGEIGEFGSGAPIALAYDTSANRFGLAYRARIDSEVRFVISTDGGATWSKGAAKSEAVATAGENAFKDLAIAMRGGKVHLAVLQPPDILYFSGDGVTWSKERAPLAEGRPASGGIGLALDSDGKPAIAFLMRNAAGDGVEPHFWRPGGGIVQVAAASAGGDEASVRVSFRGTRPWIAFYGKLNDKFYSDNHVLWSFTSEDGAKWTPGVLVPNDGGQSPSSETSVGTNTKGQAIIAAHVAGGNRDNSKCGQPMLSRSSDLARWSTCGLSALGDQLNAVNPSAIFASNDKLYIAYQSLGGESSKVKAGLALWRER
jgi:hypothetical protein